MKKKRSVSCEATKTNESCLLFNKITEMKTGKILTAAELKQFLKSKESN